MNKTHILLRNIITNEQVQYNKNKRAYLYITIIVNTWRRLLRYFKQNILYHGKI